MVGSGSADALYMDQHNNDNEIEEVDEENNKTHIEEGQQQQQEESQLPPISGEEFA